jgi:hypothetical protein
LKKQGNVDNSRGRQVEGKKKRIFGKENKKVEKRHVICTAMIYGELNK